MLDIKIESSGYGQRAILSDVSLCVRPHQVIAIIGPNGSGKSTIIKSIAGLARITAGQLRLDDREISHWSTDRRVRAGIVSVAQGARVFQSLSVRDNLSTLAELDRRQSVDRAREIAQVLDWFPALSSRLNHAASVLSGGERQQLALARALLLRPKILLLDEPSLGLDGRALELMLSHVRLIATQEELGVLFVEQNVAAALQIADEVVAVRHGRIHRRGLPNDFRSPDVLRGVFWTNQ